MDLSWIDKLITKVEVLYNFVTSDHKPLAFECCNFTCASICAPASVGESVCVDYVTDWSAVDSVSLLKYQYE